MPLRSLAGEGRPALDQYPAHGPVRPQDPVLVLELASPSGVLTLAHRFEDAPAILRMDHRHQLLERDRGLVLETEDAPGPRRPAVDPGQRIEVEGAEAGGERGELD